MPSQLVDIGANLTHSSFQHDISDVLGRAREHDVARIVVTGADERGVHDAHADFIACMDNVRGRVGQAVVHCFTGTKDELFDYLDRDFFIGITGWICDERRGTHLRELVASIPADRLMLETDAPYLLPRDVRPMPSHRRNEPMYLAHICAEVARNRGEDVAATAAQTATTATRFFALAAA